MLTALPVLLLGAAVCAFGLGWPVAARLALDPAEKLLAALVLSLLAAFAVGWIVYTAALPLAVLWTLPAAAAAALAASHRSVAAALRAPSVREALAAQAAVTGWTLLCLAFVATYSGGGWTADWFEHWERARFFVERRPLDTLFIDHAALTARPPLANVLVAAGLALTRVDFARYQLFSTLLASLAFLPAAVLAQRWAGPRAARLLAVLFCVNPLFVQNATFAWTKLPAACFVLAALVFFLRAASAARPLVPALLFAAALAAGLLAHYSAGPAAVVFAGAWLVVTVRRRTDRAWLAATGAGAAVGALLLALWFGWAVATYGPRATFLANTSVEAAAPAAAEQLARVALNLRDTLVPHFFRSVDPALIAQRSAAGALRDTWFQFYQVTLPGGFGALGALVLAAALARARPDTPPRIRRSWTLAVAAFVGLGVAAHGARDTWGLAHICLQPLVLLGLAWLAARIPAAPPLLRAGLAVGAAFDLVFGIALHLAVQNFAFERLAGPAAFATWQTDHTAAAVMNLAGKLRHELVFFADTLPLPPALLAVAAVSFLAAVIHRALRAPAAAD